MEPASGSVRVQVDGAGLRDPWRWSSPRVARTFGVVFQNPEHQFVTGHAVDELVHSLRAVGVPADQAEARSRRMLERLHLTDLAGADPFTLSGGEQRRLSVGTALVLDPGILVLDEPTFGQDPTTWVEVVDIIAAHRDAGGAVLLATHDPDLVRALGAREVALEAADTSSGPGVPPVPGVPPGSGSSAPPAGAPDRAPADGGGTAAPEAPVRGAPVGGEARLRRLDPLALLGAAMLLSVAALASASVALNLLLASGALLVALAGGIPARRAALLTLPVAVAAASVALSNALLSSEGITSAASWSAAALPASRILAVALPGLVAAIALDPTALADSLVARLRVPARAAYSALAGLRLLPLLADEWATLGRASRARGLVGSGVRQRAGQFGSMTFRLLVAALRRAGRLAIALDIRGLASDTPRTIARPLSWGRADTMAVLLGAGVLTAVLSARL
jgi:energy-coupling factor transport system ATP-binding protein